MIYLTALDKGGYISLPAGLVIDAMQRCGKPMSRHDISVESGVPAPRVNGVLTALREHGAVVQVGRCRWAMLPSDQWSKNVKK